MLRLFFARLGLVCPRAIEESSARPTFSDTVLAWDTMTREVESGGQNTRSVPVDNFS